MTAGHIVCAAVAELFAHPCEVEGRDHREVLVSEILKSAHALGEEILGGSEIAVRDSSLVEPLTR